MDMWIKVLEKIRSQLSKPSFDTWFNKTTAEVEENVLHIYAPNDFTIDWLEHQYSELIANAVKEITGEDYSLRFEVTEEKLASIFPNAHFESEQSEPDTFSRLERKIDLLEHKIQYLIDAKRLDEKAEQLEVRISKLEQQVK